jgi:hypothetical protein
VTLSFPEIRRRSGVHLRTIVNIASMGGKIDTLRGAS